jgi:molecular chaperone GrpE
VVTEESKEHEPNTVIEVLQKGYMLKEKVIRPSMVKVSI